MHGGESERKRRRHMWPVPDARTGGNTAAEASFHPDAAPVNVDSILKDGRRFFIGDCALFQAGNSPPFIGIIRWFSPGNLTLGVSRLYRPSEVKLSKGILLEAAPNEVFYSFNKDEISSELLLHPCKVAFLRKDVELPQWVSSFVCRRVYDSSNKCLWWLTDQTHIDDQQEEVAKLLVKTREEMHAAVQSGGPSPKRLNSPAQQSKSNTEGTQTSTNTPSVSSHAKGKKRTEKDGQISDSANKRERLVKAGDEIEGPLRPEIEKITERGALTSIEAVDKLVQILQVDRKIDLPSRKLLADVISATEKSECLERFILLKGVPLLDDWLQEAHRGKSGDGASPKEGEKSATDELLLAVLHALDKLPVNLDALQASNVGKSVNHLRSHKNSEIQKKARGLVDTWKKRVDAEMTLLELTKLKDEKSSSVGKLVSSEIPQVGSKPRGLAGHPSSCKSLSVKSNSSQPSSLKMTSALVGSKDSQGKAMNAELAPVVEEKSSGSSQSGSTSGSTLPSKVSRPRRSSNGHVSSKDVGALTKTTPLGRGSDRIGDDHGNSQRLVVRLPIPGRSPSHLEETAEKDDRVDLPIKPKIDPNVEDDRKEAGKSIPPEKLTLSMSPINALIESCAKYSETCVSSAGDDSGMNLLASVATGEISKSSFLSPSRSPGETSPQEVKPDPADIDEVIDEDSEKPNSSEKRKADVPTKEESKDATEGEVNGVDLKTEERLEKPEVLTSNSADSSDAGSKVGDKPDEENAESKEHAEGIDEKEVNMAEKEESAKVDFDLNEGFCVEEVNSTDAGPVNYSPALITIAAPAKGPFVPPEILSKSGDEPGWRGSAATSAFRPLSGPSTLSSSDNLTAHRAPRHHLDIDLNVADERATEEEDSGGLDFDLNRADEGTENGQQSDGGAHMLRDFDLNNGPGTAEEAGPDHQVFSRGQLSLGGTSLPFLPGISTWFPPGNTYPAMAVPPFLPERVDHGQQAFGGGHRIMGPAGGAGPFGGELYRGPVLSSSPALNFSYASYPFGPSFPLASSSYSYTNDSGPPTAPPGFGAVSSPYMRPFVVSIQEGGGGGPNKWGPQSLDLNAGPAGVLEIEGRAVRQMSAEDQSRVYQSRTVKRKEPEGGWDGERFPCK